MFLLVVVVVVMASTTTTTTAFSPEAPSSIHNKATVEPEVKASAATARTATARESAVLVEWERMSELERRIEDGVNYEHAVCDDSNVAGRPLMAETVGTSRGIFCGYKTTKEEHDRLKSADPRL